MTSKPTAESSDRSDADKDWQHHLCLHGRRWIAYQELAISIADIGFRQGVVAVERLRTYDGHPFQVSKHLQRWGHTNSELAITDLPTDEELFDRIDELLRHNRRLVEQYGDVGISILATPGIAGQGATLIMHLNPINHELVRKRQTLGQPLVVTDVCQPDPLCWPRSIKVRARIHYYLADRAARDHHPDAVGVLIDSDGSVTETSIANIAIVEAGEILSPPHDRVLGGITQDLTIALAQDAGIDWRNVPITPARLRVADEVLLMGTDGGLWFADSVDGQSMSSQKPGVVTRELQQRFAERTKSK